MPSGNLPNKRPLIRAQAKDPVMGGEREALIRRQQDPTYIGGYSDVRQRIDESIRKGQTPSEGLRHRLHLVTVVKPNGQPDMHKPMNFSLMGYKAMAFDEAKDLGYTMPPHAIRTADGHIRIGDTEVYYCDAENAEQLLVDGRDAIDRQTTAEATSGSLRDAGRGIPGVSSDHLVSATLDQRHEVVKGS